LGMRAKLGMDKLLAHLLKALSSDDAELVQGWWVGLPGSARQELAILWDERGDSCAWTTGWDELGRVVWRRLPIVSGWPFEADEPEEPDPWWEFMEYMWAHGETYKVPEPITFRTFHICTTHEAARRARSARRGPGPFECPLGRSACPVRRRLGLAPSARAIERKP
jgi:hypothetical protein